jgi:hypothetical protein
MATKYTIDMNVAGNAEKQLDKIADGVTKVGRQAADLAKASDGASKSMDDVASSTKMSALTQMSSQLESMAGRFSAMADSIKAKGKEFITDIITETATFQDTQADLKFAFGNNWENVYEQVLQDSAKLTFSFQDVAQLASGLGRMKINPFGGLDESQQKFLSKTGQTVRALEIIQDAADASGRDSSRFMFSLREAISGDMKSIRDALDLPKTVTEKWKKEVDKLTDSQAKYNYMIKELGAMYGGAGALKAQNYNKIMAQIPDLLQQLKAGAGAEGLKLLTADINEFVGALSDFVKNPENIKALREAFVVLITPVRLAVQLATYLMGVLADIFKMAPWLPKLAAGFIAVVGSLMLVAAVGAGVAMTLASIVTFMTAIGAEAIAVGTIISIALAPLIAISLLGLMSMVMLIKAVGDTGRKELGGTATTLEKIKAVFNAVWELISTFNGKSGQMSQETYAALKKSGMEGFVDNVVKAWLRLSQLWDGFTETMSDLSIRLGPVAKELLGELGNAFMLVAKALGWNTLMMQAGSKTGEEWKGTGVSIAEVLVNIAWGFARATIAAVKLFNFMMEYKIIHVIVGMIAAGLAIIGTLLLLLAPAALMLMTPFLLIVGAVAAIVAGLKKAWEIYVNLKGTQEQKNELADEKQKDYYNDHPEEYQDLVKMKQLADENNRRKKAGLPAITQDQFTAQTTKQVVDQTGGVTADSFAKQLNLAQMAPGAGPLNNDAIQNKAYTAANHGVPAMLDPKTFGAMIQTAVTEGMKAAPAPVVKVADIDAAQAHQKVAVSGV